MKNALFSLLLLFSVLTFTGCPVGLDYPPDTPGSKSIDKDLLGTWTCSGAAEDCEIIRVKFERHPSDNNTYQITVLERGSMYALETDNLQGWITEVNGTTILYCKPENEEKYYLYTIEKEGNNTLYSSDISLKVGGVDAVTSTEALREEIKASQNFEDFLSSRKEFTKE